MNFKHCLWATLTLIALSFAAVSCDDDDDVTNQIPEPENPVEPEKPDVPEVTAMKFDFKVENLSDVNADVIISPDDKSRTYFADIALKELIDGMSDEQLVVRVMNMIATKDYFKGEQTIAPHRELKPSTDYVVFAFAIDGNDASLEVSKQPFSTNEASKPVLEIEVKYEYSNFQYIVHCRSHDAERGAILELWKKQMDELLADENVSEWDLLNPENELSMRFLDYDIGDLNDDDYGFAYSFIEGPGRTVSFLLYVENYKGGRTIRRDDIFLGEGSDGKAPEVEFMGVLNEELDALDFTIKCTSQNAFYIGQVGGDAAYLDMILGLDYSNDLSQLVTSGWCWMWFADDIKAANADGAHVYLGLQQGLQYGMTGAMIIDVRTKDCGRTVLRRDLAFPAPEDRAGATPTAARVTKPFVMRPASTISPMHRMDQAKIAEAKEHASRKVRGLFL